MLIRIRGGANPYRDDVQGRTSEPITVAAFLDQAHGVVPLDRAREATAGRVK